MALNEGTRQRRSFCVVNRQDYSRKTHDQSTVQSCPFRMTSAKNVHGLRTAIMAALNICVWRRPQRELPFCVTADGAKRRDKGKNWRGIPKKKQWQHGQPCFGPASQPRLVNVVCRWDIKEPSTTKGTLSVRKPINPFRCWASVCIYIYIIYYIIYIYIYILCNPLREAKPTSH